MSQYPPAGGYGHQPPAGHGPPAGPYGGYGYGPPPDHPDATTILVLGILGLVVCSILAPFAWSKGNKALEEIQASQGALGGHGMVQAGRICGIVGTIMLIVTVVFIVLYLLIAVAILSSFA